MVFSCLFPSSFCYNIVEFLVKKKCVKYLFYCYLDFINFEANKSESTRGLQTELIAGKDEKIAVFYLSADTATETAGVICRVCA